MTEPTLRYADGPTTVRSVHIDAPADRVWDLVADPALPANFSEELQAESWDPDGPPPGLDARIIGYNEHPAVGQWSTTSYVTTWEEGRALSWVVADRDAPAGKALAEGTSTLEELVASEDGTSEGADR